MRESSTMRSGIQLCTVDWDPSHRLCTVRCRRRVARPGGWGQPYFGRTTRYGGGAGYSHSHTLLMHVTAKRHCAPCDVKGISIIAAAGGGLIHSAADADGGVTQVEFYFSESNLPRDRFLRAEVAKTPNGAVSLALVCSFSRMRALLDIASATSDVPDTTVNAVAACLQAGAASLMLEKPDGTCTSVAFRAAVSASCASAR
jgi:hypothetical protein